METMPSAAELLVLHVTEDKSLLFYSHAFDVVLQSDFGTQQSLMVLNDV